MSKFIEIGVAKIYEGNEMGFINQTKFKNNQYRFYYLKQGFNFTDSNRYRKTAAFGLPVIQKTELKINTYNL